MEHKECIYIIVYEDLIFYPLLSTKIEMGEAYYNTSNRKILNNTQFQDSMLLR